MTVTRERFLAAIVYGIEEYEEEKEKKGKWWLEQLHNKISLEGLGDRLGIQMWRVNVFGSSYKLNICISH